jgi:Ice-binding-like
VSIRGLLGAIAAGCLLGLGPLAAGASASPAPVDVGTAAGFAVFGGATVTSAGVSTLNGDLGVSPGTAATGFPPGHLNGALHAGDAVAAAAHADLATAYADAAGRTPATPITGDLGGVTLTPGVYGAGAALTLAGTLTLDAQGDPDAVFILQAGSTLGTGADSHVTLAGGAQGCNVFWQVGSSATLGASSSLAGSILASTSISMGDGVTINGGAFARDGAVTLINDTITAAQCSGTLSNTAPPITPFTLKLSGLNSTVHADVGAWNVTDDTATNAGYAITVAASPPTVNGSAAAAGTGGSLLLTPPTATAAPGNPAGTGPSASPTQTLGIAPTTIENAAPGTGQGQWNFAPDPGAPTPGSLAILIPGDASAGAYSTTLTFTTAPAAA